METPGNHIFLENVTFSWILPISTIWSYFDRRGSDMAALSHQNAPNDFYFVFEVSVSIFWEVNEFI